LLARHSIVPANSTLKPAATASAIPAAVLGLSPVVLWRVGRLMVFNDGSDTYDEVRSLILKARTLRASRALDDIRTRARVSCTTAPAMTVALMKGKADCDLIIRMNCPVLLLFGCASHQ
jgi:hypothetical protein